MPSDYRQISDENRTNYGVKVASYGPKLFANRYSDRTHFIFELLQNAEDALRWRGTRNLSPASERSVEFALFPDRLEVRHYGAPFNTGDVEAICGLAESTKEDELTTIGRFGIGFKSVFAYTQRPEVHSGDEHFAITSFVNPSAVPPRETRPGQTLFYLPFDNADVPPQQAFREIGDRLKALSLRTLLFLECIDEIAWRISDTESGQYLRDVSTQDAVTRRVTLVGQDTAETSEDWIVFQRPVYRSGSDPAGHVEIAYRLITDDTNNEQVLPVRDSNLVVFFPTEKATNLGFLIQGPYRTTLTRDNVPKDDAWNKQLVNETGQLIVQSLSELKDNDLLTVSTLNALPIDENQFGAASMFHPLFVEVKKAFKENALIPRFGGGFTPADTAKLARGEKLRELLSPTQLRALYRATEPQFWVTEDVSEDKTPILREYLRSQLGVDVVAPQTIAARFTPDFIASQPDEWVASFYGFLIDQQSLWRDRDASSFRSKPFIRLENGAHVTPFGAGNVPNAYLPGEHPLTFQQSNEQFVNPMRLFTS
jgi:hypothetical protein